MNQRVSRRAKSAKRILNVGIASVAGFLDIGISCLVIGDVTYLDSFRWGLVGAFGIGSIYLLGSVASDSLNSETDSSRPSYLDRFERFSEELDDLPDDGTPDPWLLRLLWAPLIAMASMLFAVTMIVVGFLRSILTIVVFAAFAPDPSAVTTLVTLAASILLQLAISALVFEPLADKHGIAL